MSGYEIPKIQIKGAEITIVSTPKRIALAIDQHQHVQLKRMAADYDTNLNVVIRALMDIGLAHLHEEDAQQMLIGHAEHERGRRAAAGKKGMEVRYGRDEGSNNDDHPTGDSRP